MYSLKAIRRRNDIFGSNLVLIIPNTGHQSSVFSTSCIDNYLELYSSEYILTHETCENEVQTYW